MKRLFLVIWLAALAHCGFGWFPGTPVNVSTVAVSTATLASFRVVSASSQTVTATGVRPPAADLLQTAGARPA